MEYLASQIQPNIHLVEYSCIPQFKVLKCKTLKQFYKKININILMNNNFLQKKKTLHKI